MPKPKPKPKSTSARSAPETLNPQRLTRLQLIALITSTGLTSLSSATVGNWIAAGCPRNPNGTFSLVTLTAWLVAQRRELKRDSDSDRALALYRETRTELAKLDLAVKSGELLDRRAIVDQWRVAGAKLRSAFEHVERRFGRDVGDAIRDALAEAEADLDLEARDA